MENRNNHRNHSPEECLWAKGTIMTSLLWEMFMGQASHCRDHSFGECLWKTGTIIDTTPLKSVSGAKGTIIDIIALRNVYVPSRPFLWGLLVGNRSRYRPIDIPLQRPLPWGMFIGKGCHYSCWIILWNAYCSTKNNNHKIWPHPQEHFSSGRFVPKCRWGQGLGWIQSAGVAAQIQWDNILGSKTN